MKDNHAATPIGDQSHIPKAASVFDGIIEEIISAQLANITSQDNPILTSELLRQDYLLSQINQ